MCGPPFAPVQPRRSTHLPNRCGPGLVRYLDRTRPGLCATKRPQGIEPTPSEGLSWSQLEAGPHHAMDVAGVRQACLFKKGGESRRQTPSRRVYALCTGFFRGREQPLHARGGQPELLEVLPEASPVLPEALPEPPLAVGRESSRSPWREPRYARGPVVCAHC